MKPIKRLLIGILSLFLIIGLPISIGHAESTTLTLTAGTQYSNSASENVKFLMTFSEAIAVPSGASAHIAIYQGTGSTPYYYTWDSTNSECTAVSKTSVETCNTVAKWNLSNIRQGGNCTPQQILANILCVGTNTVFHWPDILAIYQKIALTDANVRLVMVFTDPVGTTPDGVINAVSNKAGTGKLTANAVIDGVDWCQLELCTDTISDIQLWDGNLFIRFARPMNRTLGGVSYTLGVYQEGAAIKTWNVPAANLRYYGEDSTTLCVDFPSYHEVTEVLAVNTGAQVGLSVVSSQSGTDGTLSDVAMIDGYKLAANTTVNNTDAFYKTVSVQNEKKLIITDVVCYGTNQVLITFNKSISFNTKHFAGLSVYRSKTDASMMAYRQINDAYEYQTVGSLRSQGINVDDGSSDWRRAQWSCSSTLTPYSSDGKQFTVTVYGASMNHLVSILNDTDYDLRFRFQELSGAGTANGMVDTIWATADPNDRLLSSLHDDALDQTWCSVSRWMEGGAVLNGKFYSDINEAINAAESGDTVVLQGYTYIDTVILPAGVTFDLNGQTLAADTFVAFGHVIDSLDGKGGLSIEKNNKTSFVHLQQDNQTFPLYDASVSSYRFFSYQLIAAGIKSDDVSQVKYGVKILFDQLDAYALLADEANADAMLIMRLTVGNNRVDYEFNHGIFNVLYQTIKNNDFANRSRYAITLTVFGLNDNGKQTVISAQPRLCSAYDVGQCGHTITFEGEHDSYTRAP